MSWCKTNIITKVFIAVLDELGKEGTARGRGPLSTGLGFCWCGATVNPLDMAFPGRARVLNIKLI